MVSQELPQLWGQCTEQVDLLCWSRNAQQRGQDYLVYYSAHDVLRSQFLAVYSPCARLHKRLSHSKGDWQNPLTASPFVE